MTWTILWGLLGILLMLVGSFATGEIMKPGKGVYLSGDVILGGLFPVHENSKDKEISCGHKTYSRGIQRLEAMLYAVDKINADDTLLKYVLIYTHYIIKLM